MSTISETVIAEALCGRRYRPGKPGHRTKTDNPQDYADARSVIAALQEAGLILEDEKDRRYNRFYQSSHQKESTPGAKKRNKRWTEEEDLVLLRKDLTTQEMAVILGRTYYGIRGRKAKMSRGLQ